MADQDHMKSTVDRVAEMIDKAVSTNNYTELANELGKAVREATDAVSRTASSISREMQDQARQQARTGGRTKGGYSTNPYPQGYQRSRNGEMTPAQRMRLQNQERRIEEQRRAQERRNKEAYEAKYFAKPTEPTGGHIMFGIGLVTMGIFGLVALISGLISALASGGAGGLVVTLLNVVIAGLGAALAIKGRRTARKAVKFKTYRKLLLPRLYADVKDLSAAARVPEKEVVSDLEEFSANKMIRQGHFDAQKKTFIASDEIYEQYLAAEKHSQELKAAAEAKAKAEAVYTPEVRELLDKGNSCIQMIRSANDDIPDEVVSEKLARMEHIVDRIFAEVRKRPQLAGSLNMFMNYYLPTTTKLIDAYREMDQQPVQGENIRTAKREIESSLDTINDAFEKLLDSFYKETAMDVSSDINVMKMMMKQDGLAADDLTAMQQRQEKMRREAAAANSTAKAGTAQQTAGASAAAGTAQQAVTAGTAQQAAAQPAPQPTAAQQFEQFVQSAAPVGGYSQAAQAAAAQGRTQAQAAQAAAAQGQAQAAQAYAVQGQGQAQAAQMMQEE